jgi:multisubunit Na+/H+ antiporter MnhG subunit
MGLDIRIPLGLIFILIGGVMTIFGLFTQNSAIYDRSMGVNLNMGWGGIMLIFGAVMFFFGRRQKWQDDPVSPRPWERGKGMRR